MHWLRWTLLAAALAASPSWAKAEGKPKPDAAPKPVEQCGRVRGEVRNEAYGYTHLVVLKNACNKVVVCEVWTDVDPTPRQSLRAAPGETAEVITRRGSPAREVHAESSCRYE